MIAVTVSRRSRFPKIVLDCKANVVTGRPTRQTQLNYPLTNEVNNHTCEEFVKTFNTTLDHHAPYCFVSRKEQHTFEKPWLTKGILKSAGTKNKMFKKQIESSDPHLN